MNIRRGLTSLIAGATIMAAGAINSIAEDSYTLIKQYGLPMLAKSYVDATYSNPDIRGAIAKKPGKTLEDKRKAFEESYAKDYQAILDVIHDNKNWRSSKAEIRANIVEELKREDGWVDWDSKRIADSLDNLNDVRYELLKRMYDSKTDLSGAEGYMAITGEAFKDKSERVGLLNRYAEALKKYNESIAESLIVPFGKGTAAKRLEAIRVPEVATNGTTLGLITPENANKDSFKENSNEKKGNGNWNARKNILN